MSDDERLGRRLDGWVAAPWPPSEVMTGQYCRVEPLSIAKHSESLFAANQADSRGAMWDYLAYGPFATLPDYQHWLETECLNKEPQFYAIVEAASERALGLAAYLRIFPDHGSVEVGHLSYSPALQRSRIATEAMYLMMANAFDLGYRRYEWKCNSLNAASKRAAERLGFRYEGCFRQALVSKGRNRDTNWYSIIDSEWPPLQRAFVAWLAPENFGADGKQKRSLSHFQAQQAIHP